MFDPLLQRNLTLSPAQDLYRNPDVSVHADAALLSDDLPISDD